MATNHDNDELLRLVSLIRTTQLAQWSSLSSAYAKLSATLENNRNAEHAALQPHDDDQPTRADMQRPHGKPPEDPLDHAVKILTYKLDALTSRVRTIETRE